MNEIYTKVEAMKEMGASKTSANQMIRKQFAYKDFKEKIDEAISELYGDTSSTTVDWEMRVRIIRENEGLSKKDLLAKLMQYEDKKSSLTQMLGYIEMCKEWAKQELES